MPNMTVVPFHDHELEAVVDATGEVWVPAIRVFEALGFGPVGQRQRLTDTDRSPWARTCSLTVTARDGKPREMFCMDLDTMAGWLFTIESSRLKDPAAKARVILYQREAARALRDYFTTGVAVNPRFDEAALRREFEGQMAELATLRLESTEARKWQTVALRMIRSHGCLRCRFVLAPLPGVISAAAVAWVAESDRKAALP